jgi:hypothetical protein
MEEGIGVQWNCQLYFIIWSSNKLFSSTTVFINPHCHISYWPAFRVLSDRCHQVSPPLSTCGISTTFHLALLGLLHQSSKLPVLWSLISGSFIAHDRRKETVRSRMPKDDVHFWAVFDIYWHRFAVASGWASVAFFFRPHRRLLLFHIEKFPIRTIRPWKKQKDLIRESVDCLDVNPWDNSSTNE